jgi:hypothetical protein
MNALATRRAKDPFFRQFHQAPFHWILPNVLTLAVIVAEVPNSPFVESGLPYLQLAFSSSMNLVRASTFNKLHGSFQAAFLAGSDEKMKVVGHDDEFVKEIVSVISIAKETLQDNLGVLGHAKNLTAFPRPGGHKVCALRMGPMRQFAHLRLRG